MPSFEAPALNAFAVTPHDTNALTHPTRAIYVGTIGNVKLTTVDGDTVTFVNVSGILPVRAKILFATLTTATNIVGLY